MARLWGSDWSWSTLELASSGDSKTLAQQRAVSEAEERKELDFEGGESAPLLPDFLRIATPRPEERGLARCDVHESPFASSSTSTLDSTPESAFAAFARRPPIDRPGSNLREPSKGKFARKSVAFADPEEEDEEAAPRVYKWQRTVSTESGGMGGRKSSLHRIDDFCPESCPTEASTPCSRLKAAGLALRHLGREVLSLYHALHDPRTPRAARILPWLVVMFARSPLSPIPDFLPVFSVLNNLLLMPGLIWLAIHCVPSRIMDEARRRAAEGPVLLSRSWLTPVLIFLVWLLGLEASLYAMLRAWGSESVKENVWIILPVSAGMSSAAFLLWLLSLDGDWELMLMYGVEYKEMSTLHWLEDAAPQVSHKRRAGKVYEGGPVTP